MSSLYIVTKVRNEHLSDEEIRKREEKQKKMKEKMNQHQSNHMKKSKSKQLAAAAGTSDGGEVAADLDDVNLDDDAADADLDDFDEFMIEHRPSLPRPPKTNVSWSEYITADEARWPTLGRKMRCKETRKEFKAQLAMVRFMLFRSFNCVEYLSFFFFSLKSFR